MTEKVMSGLGILYILLVVINMLISPVCNNCNIFIFLKFRSSLNLYKSYITAKKDVILLFCNTICKSSSTWYWARFTSVTPWKYFITLGKKVWPCWSLQYRHWEQIWTLYLIPRHNCLHWQTHAYINIQQPPTCKITEKHILTEYIKTAKYIHL